MYNFSAEIKIIGINPFVYVPPVILTQLFEQAGKDKGPIPVYGILNQVPYKQTLVKYSGEWRFYINTVMLRNSPKRIGETVEISIAVDTAIRSLEPHPGLLQALADNRAAEAVFRGLRPSLQQEIIRYISRLKNEESIERNISRAIAFLSGKGRFIGRDKP